MSSRVIAQDVFIRVFKGLGKFDPSYSFSTWLHRVAVNLAIDFSRRHARYRHESMDLVTEAAHARNGEDCPDAQIGRKELRGIIHRLARTLSAQQRQVFVLRDLQGFSTEEIARILECSPSTVRVHLARARIQIREALTCSYPEYAGGVDP